MVARRCAGRVSHSCGHVGCTVRTRRLHSRGECVTPSERGTPVPTGVRDACPYKELFPPAVSSLSVAKDLRRRLSVWRHPYFPRARGFLPSARPYWLPQDDTISACRLICAVSPSFDKTVPCRGLPQRGLSSLREHRSTFPLGRRTSFAFPSGGSCPRFASASTHRFAVVAVAGECLTDEEKPVCTARWGFSSSTASGPPSPLGKAYMPPTRWDLLYKWQARDFAGGIAYGVGERLGAPAFCGRLS